MQIQSEFLTIESTAKLLEVGVSTIRRLSQKGEKIYDPTFPKSVSITEKSKRYSKKDIEEWFITKQQQQIAKKDWQQMNS